MAISRESFETDVLDNNLVELGLNAYPGRGIVIGETVSANLMQVYWIMGRSEGSRNRILRQEGRVVRTAVFDESKEKGDPVLTIYTAMSEDRNRHVVSNGAQTDVIVNGMQNGLSLHSFEDFIDRLAWFDHEPDAPNFTPRISAYSELWPNVPDTAEHSISIIRRDSLLEESVHEFRRFRLTQLASGLCIHTYAADGSPLPAFEGDPYPVPVGNGARETAELYWGNLNPDNRVAVAAKEIDRQTGEVKIAIINRHQAEV